MIVDAPLLLRYARDGSEDAFTRFVGRHIDLVYSAALRRCDGDAHRAEEAVQQVFISVARHAERLAQHPAIEAWLYTATRNAVINLAVSARRRAHYEQEAAMTTLSAIEESAADWNDLRPVIDSVMDELGNGDRTAVLLRFFHQRSFAEIGTALGLSENTARMRTERALEKLRRLLAKRGVRSTGAALGLVLGTTAVQAAPAALLAAVVARCGRLATGSTDAAGSAAALFNAKNAITAATVAVSIGLVTLGIYALPKGRNGTGPAQTTVVAQPAESPRTHNLSLAPTSDPVAAPAGGSILRSRLAEAGENPPSSPEAVEILQKMAAAYATLTSYQDQGEVVIIPRSGRGALITIAFALQLEPPSKMVINWEERFTAKLTFSGHIIVAADGTTTLKQSMAKAPRLCKDPQEALVLGFVSNHGGGYHVPSMFLPKTTPYQFRLTDLVEATVVESQDVEGKACYHLKGRCPNGPGYELWIARDDFLLRKLKTNGSAMSSMFPFARPDAPFDFEETHRNIRMVAAVTTGLVPFTAVTAAGSRRE